MDIPLAFANRIRLMSAEELDDTERAIREAQHQTYLALGPIQRLSSPEKAKLVKKVDRLEAWLEAIRSERQYRQTLSQDGR
jgi:hypothetical protein